MSAPNRKEILRRLRLVAAELGELRDSVMLVGGSAAATYGSDSTDVRPTQDVDLVIDGAYAAWSRVQQRLRGLGFRDNPHVHQCRLEKQVSTGDVLRLDVMPAVGDWVETNRWYSAAFASRRLDDEVSLFVIDPTFFLATKIEAFLSPSREFHHEPRASHDIEDVVRLLSAMPELREAVETGAGEEARFVRFQLRKHIAEHPDGLAIILDLAPRDLASQRAAEALHSWMLRLSPPASPR